MDDTRPSRGSGLRPDAARRFGGDFLCAGGGAVRTDADAFRTDADAVRTDGDSVPIGDDAERAGGGADRMDADTVRFGVDSVRANPPGRFLSGCWGMVTNDAARCAMDPGLLSRQALLDAGVALTRLFSPEHGITRFGADGEAMVDGTDPVTGLPVCSLYGDTMRPPAELLAGLDGVIFDIPDIGSRFYTYIWTLSHVMEACADAGRPLVVLDRVNPLGGDLSATEGPVLDVPRCASFLGRAPVPVRHGLTAGEFALWLASHWKLGLDLEVVPVQGWNRRMQWPDCGLPFIPTSPAIPSFESALCYPGTCLFEAANISIGRETEMPFRVIGAPWMGKAETSFEKAISAGFMLPDSSGGLCYRSPELPGVRFRDVEFVPGIEPWKGQLCRGIRLEVTDRAAFRPVRTGLALMAIIRRQYPDEFRWRTYPTAANPTGEGHFERLIGVTDIRPLLEEDPEALLRSLPGRLDTSAWQKDITPFLCYPK